MTKTFKAFLLVTLLLTLPLRSFASVMLVHGQGHNHDANAVMYQMDDASTMKHHHDHGKRHDSNHDKKADTCSTCGACCTGALSNIFNNHVFANHFTASQPVAFLNHPYPSFFPDGPERPPQTSFH
ncbi:hypothetical protein [Sulfurirhabdus autotrophica]|uniref:DUF2946 domain-containing protein n=1 Tax=Sulfurirhabdus autotrophica TaxID=1706046 RepID=A0A4R3YCW1_9PROT|nr:hypothetical protein [Sulfurirhabdus autotrophica]TCV90305.1 hypothetical protein EDC63_101275 [Sulfurirhabdus autotrophica]